MVAMMNLTAIAYVGYKLGDCELILLCVILISSLLGFFLLNYPFGLIFLGDGGAYFTGFIIGIASIMIVKKHSEVSPWFAFLVNIYPVYETIFSIYRRKILRKKPAMHPDGIHLHTLFYRILIKKFLKLYNPVYRNPVTSVFLWIFNALGLIPAVLFWDNTMILIIFSILFAILYTYFYWKIIKLKIPKISFENFKIKKCSKV